jgi:branched-chain amino acid transport system ATP-binding protein
MAARSGTDGRRDWTCERILETFPRLGARLSHGGQQLSGGEQQMLSIGRALMTNPILLILDEATEGLAPLVAREIWRILAAVRQSGIAVRQLEVAMCMATQPKLLLLDEPLAGMSAEESTQMVRLIDRIGESHAALLIEHDMDAVFQLARVLTVMVAARHGSN